MAQLFDPPMIGRKQTRGDLRDKGLPDCGLPGGNCCQASHADVNCSLCRSGILYEVQVVGRSPRRSVHAGGQSGVEV